MTKIPPVEPIGIAAELIRDSGINRLRFEGAADLLAHGGALIDETAKEKLGGARLLLVVQTTRAAHTFESVISLCRIGRGVQAAMLNRALLEDVLDIHWVAANPEQAPALADEHDRLINLAERATMVRFGRPADPLSANEAEELKALARTYDNYRAPWSRASDEARIGLIKGRWGEEAGDKIDFVYELIQRQNNVQLHGSPTGYRQAMSIDEEGRPKQINRIGPDRRWRESLGHGVLGYYMVCRVLAEEFGLDKDPLAEVFHRTSCFVKLIPAEDLEVLSESDPCPCGSTRAVSRCHRS